MQIVIDTLLGRFMVNLQATREVWYYKAKQTILQKQFYKFEVNVKANN